MTKNANLINIIENFLNEQFIFRRIQIYEYFGNKEVPIRWTFRDKNTDYSELDKCNESSVLFDGDYFYRWSFYNKKDLILFADLCEAALFNMDVKSTRSEIKTIIKNLITNSDFIKTLYFNPLIKDLINEGRHIVRKVKPVRLDERTDISLNVGSKCYVCIDDKPPYIANPCYISKRFEGGYRVMFFTNMDNNFNDTYKSKINGLGFTTVFANEIGLTLEQAVRQKQN